MSAARSERQLALETAAARSMRDFLLTITDDGQAIADTVDGETDLREAIRRVHWCIIEDNIQIAGLKESIEAMQARESRFKARVERLRTAIEKGMAAGELTKLELPEATLSLRHVPAGLEVLMEGLIPEKFWLPQPPKLDKAALKAALNAGEQVPGATLGNGSQSLSIRRA